MQVLRVAAAQTRNAVGDIGGNIERAAEAMRWAEDAGADVLVLPELSLTGYPVEDLVLHPEFVAEADAAVDALARRSGDTVTLVGAVQRVPPQRSWDSSDRSVSISQVLVSHGERRGTYHKVLLPTHGGYDEGRNIAPGNRPDALWRIGDVIAGVSICEDLWSGDGPPEAQSAAGARVLFAPNASPYHRHKPDGRLEMAKAVARRNGVPLVYVNLVGGQDELVFDGGSLVLDGEGELLYRAAEFAEERFLVDVPVAEPRPVTAPVTTVHTRPVARRHPEPRPEPTAQAGHLAQVWQALVTGTRDFAEKNGFTSAILALSGGIDSAVTAAVAADALGPDRVLGVAMPATETPANELEDAMSLATGLGIRLGTVHLDEVEAGLTRGLAGLPDSNGQGVTDALHQRARASVIGTAGAAQGHLVLMTGNKTEMSIGGASLEAGAGADYAPLKDCPKTLVYALARHRNSAGETIPETIVTKASTAQRTDSNPLDSYEVLDAVVEGYIEFGMGVEDFIVRGYEPRTVLEILHRVDAAERRRRQTPPGVKVTARAFGQDRRMPITNAWRAHRRADAQPAESGAARVRVEPETPEAVVEGV